MARSKSSQAWLQRHFSDNFVKRAQKEGVRSRAVYKLAEIDERDKLIRPGMTVVDLGAAPGGWSEYAAKRVGPKGRVIALDLLPIEPIPGVDILQGNFIETSVLDLLWERLGDAPVDLVISDMAPNISGIALSDQARSVELAECAIEFAEQALRPQGTFLVKTFHGAGFDELIKHLRARFTKVLVRKPEASRAESRETYILTKGFKG
ncbi:MAG: 23S rRNA (uridine(2552)-2'-O)-methyltransferase RlmE [Gammaproteobacteria bacterium]|nr:23S rRNA (uridine(2552)-2'-O)-methyltransferase RlmE [Gammaproteobacteria bacterium]